MESQRPLTTGELAQLLVRMEEAIASTSRGFAMGMTAVAGLFVAMALAYGIALHQWGIAGFIFLFGCFIGFVGIVAVRRTRPERMQPVMDAVHHDPGRVTSVRYYTTSDSRRMFVGHWLEVKTAEHRLVMKAQKDHRELYGFLRRRCPDAVFKGL